MQCSPSLQRLCLVTRCCLFHRALSNILFLSTEVKAIEASEEGGLLSLLHGKKMADKFKSSHLAYPQPSEGFYVGVCVCMHIYFINTHIYLFVLYIFCKLGGKMANRPNKFYPCMQFFIFPYLHTILRIFIYF